MNASCVSKRIIILIIAITFSLFIAEMVVSIIISYPKNTNGTRKFLIHNQLGAYNVITWRPPYYKYWSVEGGNQVYRYNNLGLPGNDIELPVSKNNIFVMGSSFIEALNVSSDNIATAVFQNLLRENQKNNNVINLGCSGHDPYVMWYRAKFFEAEIPPEKVILVIDPSSIPYLNRRWSDSLSFDIPVEKPRILVQRPIIRYAAPIREYSSLINLTIHGYTTKKNRQEQKNRKEKMNTIVFSSAALSKLEQCIARFNQEYGSNLLVISILPDYDTNNIIRESCNKHSIHFESNESILKPENRISRGGHLNEKGNREMGEFLYSSFAKYWF